MHPLSCRVILMGPGDSPHCVGRAALTVLSLLPLACSGQGQVLYGGHWGLVCLCGFWGGLDFACFLVCCNICSFVMFPGALFFPAVDSLGMLHMHKKNQKGGLNLQSCAKCIFVLSFTQSITPLSVEIVIDQPEIDSVDFFCFKCLSVIQYFMKKQCLASQHKECGDVLLRSLF